MRHISSVHPTSIKCDSFELRSCSADGPHHKKMCGLYYLPLTDMMR